MMSQDYKKTYADHCVYVKYFSDIDFILLCLYVDNMLIVGRDMKQINKLKCDMSKAFDMKDLGPAQQILGMSIIRDRKEKKIWMSPERYVDRVLE